MERPSTYAGGVFIAAAVGAALLPVGWQLAFAAIAIGLLGLPHGAGDLAVVPSERRPGFLLAYLGCIAVVGLLWRQVPVAGMVLLLVLSAVHFATDRPPRMDVVEAWATAGLLIGGPAVFHPRAVSILLATATGAASASDHLAALLRIVGCAGTGLIVGKAFVRSGAPRRDGIAWIATLILPPLIGFSVGFVMLHADHQTRQRCEDLGESLIIYLRRVAPLLGGAAVVLVGIAYWVARGRFDATLLFAGIAALATPHMLITPLWRNIRAPGRHERHGMEMPLV